MVTRVEELLKLGFYKPIAVDDLTRTILDGYQKTAEAGRLGLDLVAVLPVDYLSDERITGEVWPKSGRASITKADVLEMAASGEVFPAKTFRQVMLLAARSDLRGLVTGFDHSVRVIGPRGRHTVGHGCRRVRETDSRSGRSGRAGCRD